MFSYNVFLLYFPIAQLHSDSFSPLKKEKNKIKKPEQQKWKQKAPSPTMEFIFCWPAISGHAAYPKVWLI